MRNINLLPKKTHLEQNYIAIVILISALAISFVFLQVIYQSHLVNQTVKTSQEIQFIESRVQVLQEQKVPDQATQQYELVYKKLEELLHVRKDWMTSFAFTLGYLPPTAVVTTMGASNKGDFGIELEFDTFDQYISFVKHIQSIPFITNLTIKELSYIPEKPVESNSEQEQGTKPDELSEHPPLLPDEQDVIRELLLDALNQANVGGSIQSNSIMDEDSKFLDSSNPYTIDEILKAYGQTFAPANPVRDDSETEEVVPKSNYYYANIEFKVLFDLVSTESGAEYERQ